MSDFEVRTVTAVDRTVVTVAGVCDLRHRDELTSVLRAAVETSPLVVVDLAAVRFLDSSGLHALVSAHEAARHRAGRVHVVNATGTVAAVLEMTGIIKLLQPPARPGGDPVRTADPA